VQDRAAYNHLGYTQDRLANSENTEMRYMQDPRACNHLGYMQDSNPTNLSSFSVLHFFSSRLAMGAHPLLLVCHAGHLARVSGEHHSMQSCERS